MQCTSSRGALRFRCHGPKLQKDAARNEFLLHQLANGFFDRCGLADGRPPHQFEEILCDLSVRELASGVAATLKALKKKFPGARADSTDGLRLDFDDGWIHARASNTEPILRIIAQADSPRRLREILAAAGG